jgi:hypothetical protein
MTSRKRSKKGEDGETGVYVREGTTSRVMAADRPYSEFYDFYSVGLEYFGYHLVYCIRREYPKLNNDDSLKNIKYLVYVMELYCCF